MPEIKDAVAFHVDGTIAHLALDRPPLNIIDASMLDAMDAALETLGGRTDLHAVVLSASGEKAFSAGVSVQEHAPDRVADTLRRFHATIRRLRALPMATIAAVRGVALGGGCELAMACDMVVAAEGARFGQPEIDVGCFPPVACALLPGLVGPKRAFELIMLGRPVSAAQAERMGLVNRVVPREQLDEAVAEWCAQLSTKSPAVARLTREVLQACSDGAFDGALDLAERTYLERLMQTADAVEGIEAFVQKRKPVWKGV